MMNQVKPVLSHPSLSISDLPSTFSVLLVEDADITENRATEKHIASIIEHLIELSLTPLATTASRMVTRSDRDCPQTR